MAAAGTDAPSWTFGLNPSVSASLVPGPGTYDVAGELLSDGVGTHFGRIGDEPTRAQADITRLVFDGEEEESTKPGPGTYEQVFSNQSPRWKVYPPGKDSRPEEPNQPAAINPTTQILLPDHDNGKDHTPRFPVDTLATDAGPGSYVPYEFRVRGPCHSIASKLRTTLEPPASPGPGQYIRVRLPAGQGRRAGEAAPAPRGFARRRFGGTSDIERSTPGPGAYQSPRFQPRIAKDITFGRRIRPAGWSSKIKDIAPFPCELVDDNNDENDHSSTTGVRPRSNKRSTCRLQAPFSSHQHPTLSSGGAGAPHRRRRRPSSVPPSTRLLRACARGRRRVSVTAATAVPRGTTAGKWDGEDNNHHNGQHHSEIRSVALQRKTHAVRSDRRTARAGTRAWGTVGDMGCASSKKSAAFGTAPQRPADARPTPGPASYSPCTLDEAMRNGKVFGVEGKSRRELFRPPPDYPGPDQYAPNVVQGRAVADARRRRDDRFGVGHERGMGELFYVNDDVAEGGRGGTGEGEAGPGRGGKLLSSVPTSTFGASKRFSRYDSEPRPGVGEYDLRAAEKKAVGGEGFSVGVPLISLAGRPAGAPYDPSLNRFIRTDDRSTPSAHAYYPETAAGSGGECGIGGHAPAPPAWTFGHKRCVPRPPAGPGPGRFSPTYEPSPPAVKFGVGRTVTRSDVSGVPWEENVERTAKGEGGGVDAKFYLPGRTRLGAKAFMSSRRRVVPRTGRPTIRRTINRPVCSYREVDGEGEGEGGEGFGAE